MWNRRAMAQPCLRSNDQPPLAPKPARHVKPVVTEKWRDNFLMFSVIDARFSDIFVDKLLHKDDRLVTKKITTVWPLPPKRDGNPLRSIGHFLKPIKSHVLARFYYKCLRNPKNFGWLQHDATENQKLINAVRELKVNIQDFVIDAEEYKQYFNQAEYATRYPRYYSKNIAEKSLEHFIAQKLLQLNPDDVYVDIASEGSPVPEIYHRLYGCMTYAQDLSYEPGIHGRKIGGNAASLPLADGSVTKIGLHCSFEHFEGSADGGFIREAERILRVGGVLIVVPLYLTTVYSIATDLLVPGATEVQFEDDAVVMAVTGWGNRHGRFYDPAHLCSRVLTSASKLEFTVFYLTNPQDIDKSCYARFALMARRV